MTPRRCRAAACHIPRGDGQPHQHRGGNPHGRTDNEASGVKTLGVRVPGELHPQFVLVAKLDGLSLNDACVRGIELYVESRQAEPDFKARVAAVLEEIEQEANSRRSAIQALLGPAAQATADKPANGTTRRRGKTT